MKRIALALFPSAARQPSKKGVDQMKISQFLTPNESRSALRPLILSGLSGLIFFLSATAGVQAETILIGSQSFGPDNGSVTASTGDIMTATMFHFGDIVSTNGVGSQTGIFLGMPPQSFGSVVLDLTGTGFDLSNSVFGTFTSTAIGAVSKAAPFALFEEIGTFTAGSFFGSKAGEIFSDADLAIALSQVAGPGTAIGFGGTLSVDATTPDATTPEPASLLLLGTGLLGLAGPLFRRTKKPASH